MKTAILSVGTELLMGQTVNTNAVYLSEQLNILGYDVIYHHTAGDNPSRLKKSIEELFVDCNLILTTGGLGPTQDDLTKNVIAEVLDDKLVVHEPSMKKLKETFQKLNREMTENNLQQAYMPSKALVLENPQGTAPGFSLEKNGKHIIAMPGPPREMKGMYQSEVKPILEKRVAGKLFFRDVRTYGIGESLLETKLLDLINNQTDPTFATYAKEGESFVRIASKRTTFDEAKNAVDKALVQVKSIVGEYIYSTEGEDLPEVVGKLLINKNITISAAESCTGGLFASTLIDVPHISKVFNRGIVTYSNESKVDELGVKEETLEKYGAVSKEIAMEMAEGLFKKTGSQLCISVTGVAGPDGGTEEKPVGLVFIGMCYNGETTYKRIQMRNVSRKWNRNYAMLAMMDMIFRTIKY